MSTEVFITSHAIVRYLERHYGMDIEKIKKEMLPDHIREKLTPETERYIIGDFEFRLVNNVIVTCVPTKNDAPQKKTRNKPKKHRSNDKRRKEKNWQVKEKYYKKNKKGRYG